MDALLTVDAHGSTLCKTVEHLAPYTATHLNRISGAMVGANRILRGLQVRPGPDATITLEPGALVAGGVILEVLQDVELDYADVLVDGALPVSGGRARSIALYAYVEDAKSTSEVRFGFVLDVDLATIAGASFVVLAMLSAADEAAEDQAGSWVVPYGCSLDALARETREGVQDIESAPFASDTGLRLRNPSFRNAPYFVHDHELLVFADRFLIPSKLVAPTSPVGFTRRGILGISEIGLDDPDVAAFDFDGAYDDPYDLLAAQWGFVVDRDIEWQEVVIYAAGDLAIAREVDPDDGRLLIFRDGLWLAPADYSIDIDGVTIAIVGGLTVGAVYHFVRLRDRVFLDTIQVQASDLSGLGAPQDHFLALPRPIDVNRNSVLLFARVTTGAEADGGYFQIGRSGFASRSGQGFWIEHGFQIADAMTLRLRGIAMTAGTVVTFGVLCLRGAMAANVSVSESNGAFYRRLSVVAGSPATGEILAAPHLDGFVTQAPVGGELVVAINEIDSENATTDGITLVEDFFAEYTLEQPPAFATEAGAFKTPRRITASSVAAYSEVSGFNANYSTSTLTVEGGAAAAAIGGSVRLRAGRLIEGLPAYVPTADKLRVALDGVKLVRGRDFDERSGTSIVVRVAMGLNQILEAWVE